MKDLYKKLAYIISKSRFSISIFMVMLVFSFFGYQIMKINMLKNAQNLGYNLAHTYALEQRGNLQFYSVLLSFGVSVVDESQKNGNLAEKIMYFFRQVQSLLGEGTIDPYLVSGNRIIALNPWEGDADYDFSNAVWYRQAVENPGKVIFTDTYIDAVYGKPVVTIARTCASGAVLAFDIFPENFRFSSVTLTGLQESSFFLCDNKGTLLYAQTSEEQSYDEMRPYVHQLFLRIKSGELASYAASTSDMHGQRRGVYYFEMPNGWISILTIPFSVILNDLDYFSALFYGLVVLLLIGMGLISWRNLHNERVYARTNEAVQVLGNSYFAVYRIDYEQARYEVIKAPDDVRRRLSSSGSYAELVRVIIENLDSRDLGEFMDKFSLLSIRRLVEHRIRDFGRDFRRLFDNGYRWVTIRVQFDESLASHDVILCFREIEEEKQKQLEEHTLLMNSLNKAKQNEKAKQLFFSNMSHEMRTPLNAIINLTGIAKRFARDPQKVLDYLNKIERSSVMLIQLVNDILELSRLAQGKIELNNQPMDIRVCLEESFTPFKIQAENEGKIFREVWNVNHSMVMGDAFRLTRIMNNLLSNAMKFTDAGDSVTVEVSQMSQKEYIQYKIVVSDTGIGMSEEFLHQIFEPYTRESRVASRPVSGTGLGMPIVKSMVELLNGSIVVDSKPGQGTTFTVILPFLMVRGEEQSAVETESAPVGGGLAGKRLLIAEDNEINMEVAEEILTLNGMKVERAWNGREALNIFQRSEPFYFDAILMDMQMPEMNGCEACKSIRALSRPDAASVPIVAVTANAFSEDIAETSRAGMSAHVSKPIDFPILCRLLEKLIKARKKKEE